jgi:lysine 2,3-aminomutase
MNDENAGSIVASPSGRAPGDERNPAPGRLGEAEEPPGSRPQNRSQTSLSQGLPTGKRHPAWSDIPAEQWNDWRWQRQHAIRTTDQLAELLAIPAEELAALRALESKYRTAIPPYYFSLIDVDNPHDPIRLQSVPSSKEETNLSGVEFDDPLEEDQDSPVPGVTHRYPDRALLITTPVCSMYCRFCTRKRVTMDREGWDAPSRDEMRMIEYVRQTEAIRDVILSGGDPLTLPVAKLRWFLEELAAIDHVDVIRVGTRVPVTLPQRLYDRGLVQLLQSVGKVWIQTHFNHPVEITPEATHACRNLINAGMPINNHSVLMKGVNDSVQTMRELVRGLLRIKVRPYYMFHCDPVTGAGHFRTSVWKGIEIIEGLRGHVSGLAVPTYVVDGLHGAGKIPVMPNYMLSSSDDAVILRNYEGMIFRYAPEDKPVEAAPVESVGVSQVLSGGGKPLIPAENPRHLRRKKKLLSVVTAEATAVLLPDKAALVANGTSAPGRGRTTISASPNGDAGNSRNRNGRAAKEVVPQVVPASRHPARPLIGSRTEKSAVGPTAAKTNGARVKIAAATRQFDGTQPLDSAQPRNGSMNAAERGVADHGAVTPSNGKVAAAKTALAAAKKRG